MKEIAAGSSPWDSGDAESRDRVGRRIRFKPHSHTKGNAMTEMKYTPGPWEFDPTCFESTIAVTPPESRLVIAEVWPMQSDESSEDETYDIKTDPISIANARLIAAAPELLELCRDLIATHGACFLGKDILKKMKEVVAKATGTN